MKYKISLILIAVISILSGCSTMQHNENNYLNTEAPKAFIIPKKFDTLELSDEYKIPQAAVKPNSSQLAAEPLPPGL